MSTSKNTSGLERDFANMFQNQKQNTVKELTTSPFYRWFILNSIHKRNFKDGNFKTLIPWITSGKEVWSVEKILQVLSSTTLLLKEETAVVDSFLVEYRKCLAYGDGKMTDELNLTWDALKRMFDLNDPNHIAGALATRSPPRKTAEEEKALNEKRQRIIREQQELIKKAREIEQEDSDLRGAAVDGSSKIWDDNCYPYPQQETPTRAPQQQKGTKRVVSINAESSGSPEKRARPVAHCVKSKIASPEKEKKDDNHAVHVLELSGSSAGSTESDEDIIDFGLRPGFRPESTLSNFHYMRM